MSLPTGGAPIEPPPKVSGVGNVEQTGVGNAADLAAAYETAVAHLRSRAFDFELESQLGGLRVELSSIRGLTAPGLLKKPYRFQLPPSDNFSRVLAHTHNDFDTIGAGQHSNPIGSQLETVTFASLLVDFDPVFAVWPNTQNITTLDDADREEIWNILNMTDQLEQVVDSGTPFLLRCGMPELWTSGGRAKDKTGDKNRQGGWDVNMPATLRSLTIDEHPGEPDARYLQVEFREYRRLDLQRRKHGKGLAKGSARAREQDTPATVEIFQDSSALDRTHNDQRIGASESQTRLTATMPMTASTLPVVSTAGFEVFGALIIGNLAFSYHGSDAQNFTTVAPLESPTTGLTLAAGSLVRQNPGKGTTLRMLAKRYYGSPGLWTHIFSASQNAVLKRLNVSGSTLLGTVAIAQGVPSFKLVVPKPPRTVRPMTVRPTPGGPR